MISIDFFNILATVINILVLFLLMQKFLVKPLMNVIEKRENMINSQFKEAEAAETEAKSLKAKYEDSLKNAHDESISILNKAKTNARAEYDRIVGEADDEAQKIVSKARTDMEQEREQTLKQLLVEMEGIGANEGIIMIAATNRPDILDPALLRPGRFDRQIMVGRPDRKGREAVLEVHTKKKPLDTNVSLEVLAKRTPGFSGADLENLANEAALLAVRKNKKKIGMDEFEEAITRVIAGPEKKSRTISEHDRKLTAYHEAGHAVVMKCLKNSDPVHEISIIPRGMAGGYTMHLPTEDRAYTSKEKLLDEMVGLLGGRVAEKLILGDISTGAKNDIDRASSIARAMVMEYGMSDKIGTISYGSDNNEVFLGRDLGRGRNFSEEVGAMIDKEIKSLISNAYNTAEELLKENVNKLHAVASTLLEKEKIDGKEFEEIFEAN